MDTVDSIDTAIFYSSIGAAVFGLSLIACQTDMISRRILSPIRLYAKVRLRQWNFNDFSFKTISHQRSFRDDENNCIS